jgi:hypothetical protein
MSLAPLKSGARSTARRVGAVAGHDRRSEAHRTSREARRTLAIAMRRAVRRRPRARLAAPATAARFRPAGARKSCRSNPSRPACGPRQGAAPSLRHCSSVTRRARSWLCTSRRAASGPKGAAAGRTGLPGTRASRRRPTAVRRQRPRLKPIAVATLRISLTWQWHKSPAEPSTDAPGSTTQRDAPVRRDGESEVDVVLTVATRRASSPPPRPRRGWGPDAGRRKLRGWALPEEYLARRGRAPVDACLHRGRAQLAPEAVRSKKAGTLRAPRRPRRWHPRGPQLPTSRSTASPVARRSCAASSPRSCG